MLALKHPLNYLELSMREFPKVIVASIAILGLFGLASKAQAACDIDGDTFYLHNNDETHHTAKTDQNGCDLHFISAGKTTEFKTASIVAKPKNGELIPIAHLEFRYRPKPGFKGNDEFALKVCGKTAKGEGCSTLHYSATVE
jgi:hypothetical protein